MMALLDKIKFHVWNPLTAVLDLVEKWNPTDCTTEKDYERSLYEWLHEQLGGVQVTKQFARGRVHADLVVADKVIIELKVNLDTTAKYQRLVGQLEEYREWKGDVVIVLFGRTDKNLRKKLDEAVEKRSGFLLFDQQMRVVQK